MKQKTKKLFSVAFALIVGVGIILFAWRGSVITSEETSTREADDSWLGSLLVVPNASTSQTLGVRSASFTDAGAAGVATSSTASLARNLILNYALTQQNMSTTTWSDSDASSLAQALVSSTEIPKAVQYTLKDLNISSDNSEVALATYGGKLFSIVQTSSSKPGTSEVAIFLSAISASDPQKISDLSSFVTEYARVKRGLIALKTPSGVAALHLRLVQNYANIESALVSMQKIFTDPVQGLAGFTEYQKEIAVLGAIGNDYKNYKPSSQ